MNHMEEIACILGVKLDEEFKINDDSTNKFKLTNSGLFFLNHVGVWGSCDHKLTQLLNGKHEIIKLPKSILTEEERHYLSEVIRPFKKGVECIGKHHDTVGVYITIKLYLEPSVLLPYINEEENYTGMKLGKDYTLQELGL